MVLRRCAWHRRYFGYPAVCGIAGWGGRGVDFSDWICRRCAARVRRHLGHGPSHDGEPPPVLWWDPFLVLPPAAATLLVAVMMLVVTSPLEPVSLVIARPAQRAPASPPALVQTPRALGQAGRIIISASDAGRKLASVEPALAPVRGYRAASTGPSLGATFQAP